MTNELTNEVKSILFNMPELKKQLRWLVSNSNTTKGQKKLDTWLEKHIYMKGDASRMKEEMGL